MDNVLVLGGAGFIGSNIAKRFVEAKYKVYVIDGLLAQTGGRKENLNSIISKIVFINSNIEDANLQELIEKCEIIIDCMAWTAHHSAIADPEYDLRLNAKVHLTLINALKNTSNKKIIYLGTRAQYGNPHADEITEEMHMIPEDIQGIHKLASESYFRVYSKLCGLNVISLRFPNCFGENQPVHTEDIGLIGDFIKDILNNKEIEVFGDNRKRCLLYVKDLSEIVFQISKKRFNGFSAFNICGNEMAIEDLVKKLIEIIGMGNYQKKEIPFEIKSIDIGNAKLNDEKLKKFLGKVPFTELKTALQETVQYFKENMR